MNLAIKYFKYKEQSMNALLIFSFWWSGKIGNNESGHEHVTVVENAFLHFSS